MSSGHWLVLWIAGKKELGTILSISVTCSVYTEEFFYQVNITVQISVVREQG